MLRKLILWLCARYNIAVHEERRINMGPDKKARSHRWQAFAEEEDGLFDMIEQERRKAFEAYSALPPEDRAGRDYLAMTDRNWRALETRINSVIAAGKVEEKNDERKANAARILKSV